MIYSTEINGTTFYCVEHVKHCEHHAWWDGYMIGMIVGMVFVGVVWWL